MGPYPSQVMYDTLKGFSHISNKDAALLLIRSDVTMGGRTIHERLISDRTYLSRNVVNAAPGMLPIGCFSDFANSAQVIAGHTVKWLGSQGANALPFAISRYSTQSAQEMAAALQDVGESPHLYMNMVASIMKRADISDRDRLSLLLLVFIVAGCIGCSGAAVQAAQAFSNSKLASDFHTEATTMRPTELLAEEAAAGRITRLGLMRKSGDFAKMRLYELSNGPEGTVIGRNPSSGPSIDDVDDVVSSDHLRIWMAKDGRWLAEGLGSTNGTVLVSGENQEETVIEPPRKRREGWVGGPVQILPGDILRLANMTEFLVIAP